MLLYEEYGSARRVTLAAFAIAFFALTGTWNLREPDALAG